MADTTDRERRIADHWARIDDFEEDAFRAGLEALLAALPDDSAIAFFKRAGVLDSFGHPDRAVPLYRQALEGDLPGERRRRAVIQVASSFRNLGDP